MNFEEKKKFDQSVNDEFNERVGKTTEADGWKALENEFKIEEIIRKSRTLSKFVDDVCLFFSLLKDYFNGRYRDVPWKSVAAITAALLYVLSPIDLVPDFIPFFGVLDDAGVLAFCLKLVKSDVDTYAKWRAVQDKTIDV